MIYFLIYFLGILIILLTDSSEWKRRDMFFVTIWPIMIWVFIAYVLVYDKEPWQ